MSAREGHPGAVFVLALTATLVASAPAAAHDFRPGVLALTEVTAGRFHVTWIEPVDNIGEPAGVRVEFPSPCRREGAALDCGTRGLHDAIGFAGLHARRMQVVVAVRWLDGGTREAVVTGRSPRFVVDARGGGAVATWLRLGVAHVAGGVDHVAFVLGLLLLVGAGNVRRLVATVTAFTLAHSLTLALAALDLVRLPRAPVEATIAASVLLVAREALREEPTLSRRAPWAVALLFGLVHGLGFAGALAGLGLPRGAVGWALLGFNLGVEVGQLGVVALAVLVARATIALDRGRKRVTPRLRVGVCYVLGSLAAWWLIERTVAIVAGR